ncbi:hypothetical protein SEPCBS57363_004053 [Sporothrix epigloea]|uniref:EngB-type G domain-containing protein n=1 Tax=Sporothrix epigloea TaxID=1892477 RepID=A0ABP0DSU1_9PEZI
MASLPQLQQAVAEIFDMPTAKAFTPLPSSIFTAFSVHSRARPVSYASTIPSACRTFTTSYSRSAMAQLSKTRSIREATRSAPRSSLKAPSKVKSRSSSKASLKPAYKASKTPAKLANSKSTATRVAVKTSSPSATQTKARSANTRTPRPLAPLDHIRALSFLPPPHTPSRVVGPMPDAIKLADDVKAAAESVRLGPTPTTAALDRASTHFVRLEPRFLYSAPRFLNLPLNTRIPEVCILGRSNVGKSTLLNALAGLESGGKAGSSHGARPSRFGLAITSARAGCTKMMNGYGFGPPLSASQQQVFERVLEKSAEDRKKKDGESSPMSTSGLSRSQKRALTPGEPSPAHSLVIIDMPGYGFMSKSEWGIEITKYLERRATLRGAILLVDAVAGLKDGDRHALAMLRDANIRTLIVLTKADKLLPPRLLRMPAAVAAAKQEERVLASSKSYAASPASLAASPEPGFQSDFSEGEQTLRTSCLRVWKTLRRIERASFGTVPWMEGQGWSPEIVVTGAGDPRGGGFGVAGARLAICRMAGLLPQHNTPDLTSTPKKTKKAAARGGAINPGGYGPAPPLTVVPFDQIQWSTTATETSIDQSAELRYIEQQDAARRERKSRLQPSSIREITLKDNQARDPVIGPKALSAAGRRRPWKRSA